MTVGWPVARRWAEHVAQSWFANGEPLLVGGIDIGWPLHIEAFNALVGIAVDPDGRRPTRSLKDILKGGGRDRAVRAHAMRVTRRGGDEAARPASTLFVTEVPTPSMMEPSILAASALHTDEVAVACADHRAIRRWRTHGYRPQALITSFRDERLLLRDARADAQRAWRRYLGEGHRFELNGRDMTAATVSALEPIVLRSAPWLVVEMAALRRVIDAVHPRSIAVASDQHRIGRLVRLVAAEGSSQVVVLQHGLPRTAIAYLPVVADTVCVWSESVRRWFVENGTSAARLCVVGNPRLDATHTSEREVVREDIRRRHRLSGGVNLLIPLSPMDGETNRAIIDIALDALAREPSLVAIVKLHPGYGRDRQTERRIRGARLGGRVRILRHESLSPLLLWAHGVFLHRSSVGQEALAAGTPVAIPDLADSMGDDELRDARLPRLRSGYLLSQWAREIATANGTSQYFSSRHDVLDAITGPRDGRAAERIATVLRSGGSRPATAGGCEELAFQSG